jgi:lipoprotein-anchoring transpeptidase ErfK/SrfK
MVDYYSVLLRAVTAPGSGDARWRRNLYDRARQMLASQLRALHPAARMAEIAAEQAALEAAIERIEAEIARTDRGAARRDKISGDRDGPIPSDATVEPERGPIAAPFRLRPAFSIAIAIVAAALGAGGYAFWAEKAHKSAPLSSQGEAHGAAPQAARPITVAKDGDLPPGVDGGSSDPDQSYVFRRQPTFYRTPQPVGTIIIDKLQHFLYLIQPNNVALRYGIGLGQRCIDLAGLHKIASKEEWPAWLPPTDMIERKLAKPGTMPGGPGNPLGARTLDLDDGASRIHGTNAPKTIGNSVTFGCIRLVNDDIVDLYDRVRVGTPVIAGD